MIFYRCKECFRLLGMSNSGKNIDIVYKIPGNCCYLVEEMIHRNEAKE